MPTLTNEEIEKTRERARLWNNGFYKIPACNPMSRGVLDEIFCTNDSRTLLLLDDLAEGLKQFKDEGLGVAEITMPEADYQHLITTSNVVRPPMAAEDHTGSILGARVKFGTRIEMESDHFEKIKDRFETEHPDRRVRNGYLMKSEEVPGFDDRFKIKTYLLHPVYDSNAGHGLDIFVKSRCRPIANISNEEWKAVDTLREMITEKQYRRYIKDGLLLVQGASGKVYQIFRKEQHIKVWTNGEVVEELCVHIEDRSVPPTDSVLAFLVMLQANEQELRRMANIYPMKKAA